MPDVVQHHAFGQDVRAALPREIRDCLCDVPYLFAQYGPDPWFMYQPWKRRQGRGRRMHTTKTGAFLTALARKARNGRTPRETFSYLAGFLCHYALDSGTHPYIIWQSTETWPTPRAHRDLEHALDIALLKREGFWGEQHPVTDHHFPILMLPDSLSADLEAVYGEVYGWKKVVPALNSCYARYRSLYVLMEKPHSFLTGLSRIVPTPRIRSIPYARSLFLARDVENLSHHVWHFPFDREQMSRESFPELREKALEDAVGMIQASYAYACQGILPLDELRARLGNRSYLSALDAEDPRNMAVPSLRPPAD